ncbi:signal peptide peptidase SppA, partial [Balneolaceae bacterium ANBcel3]|nr:signal peptide peptidase SppA [Balneolaceae bacterium ANBcel3]
HDLGITAGVQISFGRSGVSYQSHMDTGGGHRYHSYGVRLGALDRNIRDHYFNRNKQYVDVAVRGSLVYQNYRFFDNRTTFLSILESIEIAKKDPSVKGIVVNTTNMNVDPAKAWELYEQLVAFRETGKEVVVYVERGGMSHLYLIAAASYVVMDPMGTMQIPGYIFGRTYLAEFLEEVGIGVQEIRKADYKTAAESFTRTSMSDAEREQISAIVTQWYEGIREIISEEKGLEEDLFDDMINRGLVVSPDDLVEAGIVDTLARFDHVQGILNKLENRRVSRTSARSLYTNNLPSDTRWGPEKVIQVLYAEGSTSMTSGIRARVLANAIKQAAANPSVKAIVMRVDSPGGDALASDIVAEQIKNAANRKPVIISMGFVAASGGYWIAMEADSIVATPQTITGSIGVIMPHLYDDGLQRKLRLHSDFVSRGESADLSHGPSLPLIGLQLPGRPLREDEMEHFDTYITSMYDLFIDRVAEGRNLEADDVREIAGGRVWTGRDARDKGLVDELGGLQTAIQIAKEAAGIKPGDKVILQEGPATQPFSLPMLLGQVFTSSGNRMSQTTTDPMKNYIEMIIDHHGQPLMIMPFEEFSWIYYIQD